MFTSERKTYWYIDNGVTELVIQYCVYSDHEGGNVSAHTGHLVSYLGFLLSILIN